MARRKSERDPLESELPVQKYARLLDSSIRLPGGFRIGIEGIIGLIPGIGDVIGALLSSVILVQAYREGLGFAVISRMILNVALEVVVGAVPILGDIFDFVFKANLRNAELIAQHSRNATGTKRRSTAIVGVAVVVILLAIAALAVLFWQLLTLLAGQIGAA